MRGGKPHFMDGCSFIMTYSASKVNKKSFSPETVHQIKAMAAGQWSSILGLDLERLSGKGKPCPHCSTDPTDDRLHAFPNSNETGVIRCRQCLPKGTGNGIDAYAWLNGIEWKDAVIELANSLGISRGPAPVRKRDIIADVCRAKHMPLEAFMQFGPKAEQRGRQRHEVARVPVYNERGEVFSYFDFVPHHKGWCKKGQGNAGMFFPGRLPKPGETWLLVEGCKDAAALVGLGFNAAGLPGNCMATKYARLFAGVHAVLMPDLDKPGQTGAQKTGGRLSGIAASVKMARLPGEIVVSSGEDVRDVLNRPNGEGLVREAIATAEDWQPSEGEPDARDGRPIVKLTLNEPYVADQVIKCLGRLGKESHWIPEHKRESLQVFQRTGRLVGVIDPPAKQSSSVPFLHDLHIANLRERISQACELVQEYEKNGELVSVPTPPPKWLQEAIYHRVQFGEAIRHVLGIVHSPTVRKDGSILQNPGWDAATGLIYRPRVAFPKVPSAPSREMAAQAAAELLEVVSDFPMKSASDKSAWLCMVLTMIARECIVGCTPMFGITANIRGAGKSMVVDAAAIIAYGQPAARRVFSRNDEEQRKSITTVAIEAIPAVLLDNVDQQIGGAALDAAITSPVWRDRLLGMSRSTGDLPLRTVWIATGNNLLYGSDTARRVLPIRLESLLESPEDRTDFQHGDLLAWVASNRPRLVIAALTILCAYITAGRPKQIGGRWGSFEDWSDIIRGAVVWTGLADPLSTRESAIASDESREVMAMLIAGLQEADPDGCGVTARQIERLVNQRPDECQTLTEVASEICGPKFDTRRFARRLRTYLGRSWNGLRIECDSCHGGVKRYFVRRAAGGCGGCGGSHLAKTPREAVVLIRSDEEVTHTYAGEVLGNAPPPQPPQPPPSVFGLHDHSERAWL